MAMQLRNSRINKCRPLRFWSSGFIMIAHTSPTSWISGQTLFQTHWYISEVMIHVIVSVGVCFSGKVQLYILRRRKFELPAKMKCDLQEWQHCWRSASINWVFAVHCPKSPEPFRLLVSRLFFSIFISIYFVQKHSRTRKRSKSALHISAKWFFTAFYGFIAFIALTALELLALD